jgi:hypothetical protein
MTIVMSLWLPILLSAVFVFIASSIIHMLLPYHRNDFGALPNDEVVRTALRGLPPGDYATPHAPTTAAMKDPEYTQKMKTGPVALLTIRPPGTWNMGGTLAAWFVHCLVVSVLAGYVAGYAVPAGGEYLAVFRFAGSTAFAGYVLGLWPNTIWYGRSLGFTLKSSFDGLIYALLTAGTFGWLWPAM